MRPTASTSHLGASQYPDMSQFPHLAAYPYSYALESEPDMAALLDVAPCDERGRQRKFVENLVQRRERVEFLRRREWTRRISAWIDQSTVASDAQTRQPLAYAWEDVLAAADADASGSFYGDTRRLPDVIDETDEPGPECAPYVIYTASPRPRSPSQTGQDIESETSYSPSSTASPVARRGSWRGAHSRHSSLSSISEEDEGGPPRF
ncbi:hypothetical protein A0H81_05438 [Grifola frondosa]|uniref:Uncharacterized protein n=1 Tax=Grifola frondosa TaxID=5627 RepID=A0A1C7ME26_GRIFR|nr:hypothetical protein A0H81_05438 [Grifola frondosa]